MAWPQATDFIEAVQDLGVSVDDQELRGGEAVRSPLGLPILWSGNFADVFKIHCPATGNTWALKCFTRHVPGLQTRYRHVAACLEEARLPFTVDFQYLPEGIRIGQGRFPALKMRWVEGLTLNQFVEEHVGRPGNLKMLLDLWIKLSARLRQSGIAHADLQHGNVILVPTSGGSLALRLIDYDGMYVPALAGAPSGELGHPAYQHPQRLREGTYNAEIDRFSHLAIYTAIRCLMLGRGQLWQRFNNGDNLLFREDDYRNPGESELFRILWKSLDFDARALVGRLALACQARLEEAPLLDDVLRDGTTLALTGAQEAAVDALLKASAKPAAQPLRDHEIPLEWLEPPAEEGPDEGRPAAMAAGPPLEESASPAETPGDRRVAVLDAPAVGTRNKRPRALLWALLPLVVLVAVCLAVDALQRRPSSPQTAEKPPERGTVAPPATLMIEPIEPQTVETGKLLTVAVPVENPEAWEGKLRYALSGSPPSGASVDAQTGVLTWTPKAEQLSDKYTVTVSVEAPDGRRAEATVEVTVTAPVPLKLKPIEPQTVEAGKSLTLAAPVWNADAWRGNVQYGVAGQAPSGARIDAQSGAFSWLAPSDQAAGKLDVVVSVESPDGRKDQTTFTITVTRPAPQEEEAVGTETVPGTAAAPKGTLDEGGDVPGQWTRPSTTPANPFPGRDKQVSFDLGAGIKLEMVLIPEGEFLMGSPDSEEKANVDEKPAHRVRITAPFYMGKHLVTQEQWEAVMGDNPSMFRDPKNPVETVSWDDCQSFLDKLNGKLGAGWGTFKLPTEAQWEYACRARNMTNYCFGDNESGLRKNAWYGENSHGRTHPVGEKKPNAWGLFDMHGNVWEWCQDWYDGNYYAQSPGDDPSGPAQGSHRVNRGGSWSYSAWGCRCAYRHGLAPESRGSHVGLRVCSVRTDKQG